MRRRQAKIDHPADVVRPFLWVGGAFFLVGFYGYFVFNPPGL